MKTGRCVIVADDVAEICNLAAKFLEPFGYRVLAAHSGREALDLLRSNRCDAVVADVLMPDGDGIELITDLKRSRPDLRILAISGGSGSTQMDQCLKLANSAGADAVLAKPFDRKQLLAAIQSLLACPR